MKKWIISLAAALLLALCCFSSALAEEANVHYVTGNISNATFESGHTYYICNFNLRDTATVTGNLTIEPGAKLIFGKNNETIKRTETGSFILSNRLYVTTGSISALGTEEQPILFSGYDGNSWNAIEFSQESKTTSALFSHCIFMDGGDRNSILYFVGKTENDTILQVTDCEFYGYDCRGDGSLFYGCAIQQYNELATGSITVENCKFQNMRDCVAGTSKLARGMSVKVTGNVFDSRSMSDDARAVSFAGGSQTVVSENIFYGDENNDVLCDISGATNDPAAATPTVLFYNNVFNGSPECKSPVAALNVASEISEGDVSASNRIEGYSDDYAVIKLWGNIGGKNTTFRDLGAPYTVYFWDTAENGEIITVEPGVELRIEDRSIWVLNGARFIANGEEDAPIVIKSTSGTVSGIVATKGGSLEISKCLLVDTQININRTDSPVSKLYDCTIDSRNNPNTPIFIIGEVPSTEEMLLDIHDIDFYGFSGVVFDNTNNVVLRDSEFLCCEEGSSNQGLWDCGIDASGSGTTLNEPIVKNCLIKGFNTGIRLSEENALKIENCTIVDNIFGIYFTAYYHVNPWLRNSIIWRNGYDIIKGDSNDITLDDCRYNCIGTIVVKYWGYVYEYDSALLKYKLSKPELANLIDVDPLFADTLDCHLQSEAGRFSHGKWTIDEQTSPCIDAGDPDADYSLEPYPNGGRVNMGYYGNTEEASKSVITEGWSKSSSGWRYGKDGTYLTGLQQLTGYQRGNKQGVNTYFFDANGIMMRGFVKGNKLGSDSVQSAAWYYFMENGSNPTSSTAGQMIKNYYVNNPASGYKSESEQGREYRYYFDESGAMFTGWYESGTFSYDKSGKWRYFIEKGSNPTTSRLGRMCKYGLVKCVGNNDNDLWYFFSATGGMFTGTNSLGTFSKTPIGGSPATSIYGSKID